MGGGGISPGCDGRGEAVGGGGEALSVGAVALSMNTEWTITNRIDRASVNWTPHPRLPRWASADSLLTFDAVSLGPARRPGP